MMPISEGTLEKLKMVAYSTDDFSGAEASTFVALVNPSSYKNTLNIDYTTRKELGNNSESPSFQKIGKEEISFDLILDGTGVITPPPENEGKTVAQLITELKATVYQYEGEIHQPYYVQISWGSMSFNGRLNTMTLDYKMFSPSADPLRVNISLSFTRYKSIDEALAEADDQSPDMTHIITVKAGDTLPQLCKKIYGKSDYYLQVARMNHLTAFRHLKVGSELYFPPLK